MARINPEQLGRSLAQGLPPAVVVSGDETLLVQEACDQVRQHARKAGFEERLIYHADNSFDWNQLLQSANSLSLFAERRLLEVRLASGKLAEAGGKVLQEYARNASSDTCLLLIAPKLERAAQNSAWLKALDACGWVVTVWPIAEKQLHRWLEHRLKSAGLQADAQALAVLASKVEGNLLAAVQEIEKLKLVAPDGPITAEFMASAVIDSARYNLFTLADKALSGDARAAATTLNGLRAEGTEATLILWALTREIRTLTLLKQAQEAGLPLERSARQHGVFDNRLPLMRAALQRLDKARLQRLLQQCASIDLAIKGAAPGSPWDWLAEVVLQMADSPTLLAPACDLWRSA